MNKRIYFYNDEAQAVAAINNPQFTPMLLEHGFIECDNETYLSKRWLTWNEATVLQIEGTKNKKQRRK